MKKLITTICAILCCAALLAGCSSKPSDTTVKMKEGNTVQTVTDQIINEVGVAMAEPLNDTLLKDLFYIDPADVESYAGEFSMVIVNADNLVAVKAKEGKIDTVKAGLEKRQADVQKSFEQYLTDQFDKAKKGKVIVKGDYAFLLILGDQPETFDADMEKAVAIIEAAF